MCLPVPVFVSCLYVVYCFCLFVCLSVCLFVCLSVPCPAENALLSHKEVSKSILSLPERRILDGYRLVGKIENTKEKFLIGQYHHCKFGQKPPPRSIEDLLEYAYTLYS